MGKKKRMSHKDRGERDDSTDGETESPSPKRNKLKSVKKAAKLGKGKKKGEPKDTQADTKAPAVDFSQPYTCPMKQLNPFISCSLCKGYLVDATTVVECLHTFCKSCLLKYFEDEDNCCPQCGQLIHQSHPTNYVAYDRTLQDMVYKLVPGLYEAESKEREKYVKELKKQAGEDVEEEERKLEEKKREMESDCTNRCFEGKPKISHHRSEPQMLIELIRGANDLPVPEKRFIRTGEMCTVTALKRYLSYAMYGTKSRYMEMDLFCNNELMGRDFSMKFIHLTRCRKKPADQPLRLVYKHKLDF